MHGVFLCKKWMLDRVEGLRPRAAAKFARHVFRETREYT
jgi:hypothetical protein